MSKRLLQTLPFGLVLFLPCILGARTLMQTPELDQDQALNRTNYWRAKYQAPPVTWDQAVYAAAVKDASTCGQNLTSTTYGRNTGSDFASFTAFVDEMAAQAADYNYTEPGFYGDTGLFTQLVWKATTSIGCAVDRTCKDDPFFVCLYSPPGNIQEVDDNGNVDPVGTAKRFSDNVGKAV